MTDTQLSDLINRFSKLKRVDLKRQDFSDKGLELLKPNSHLEAVNCQFCSVIGPGIASLARFKNLHYLWMAFGADDPEKLDSLAKLQSVKYLDMRDSRLVDKSLLHIGKMSALENLDVKGNPRITDAGIKYLANLKHLHYINLTECYRISVAGIAQLKGLPLNQIEVSGAVEDTPGMSKPQLYQLQQIFPKTKITAISKITPMYREMLDTLK